jgi:hypothetical protein
MTLVKAPLERETMTATVQQLLNSFDSLSEADRHQAAVEILRRFGGVAEGDVPEAALVEAADELFRALDAAEAGHAKP